MIFNLTNKMKTLKKKKNLIKMKKKLLLWMMQNRLKISNK